MSYLFPYLKSFCIYTTQDKHSWGRKKVHQVLSTGQEQVPRVARGCNYLEDLIDLLLRHSRPNRWVAPRYRRFIL